MGGKFPDRGDFLISESLLDEHEYLADAFIDSGTGVVCRLYYHPVSTPCINCEIDPRSGRSSGIYKSGGPIPFENHTICPYCEGTGQSTSQPTGDIRVRSYWSPKEFVVKANFTESEGIVQVIGYMKDLPALERAQNMVLNPDVAPYREWRFERQGEAQPWGFRKNRYFVQFLKRLGGG